VGDVTKDNVLIEKLVGFFSKLPQVEVIALGGSRASGRADGLSDFDVYVCADATISLATRRDIVQQLGGASVDNLGHDYFGGGDEWRDAAGTHFDLMYLGSGWLREQVERPLKRYQPTLGYSTAFAYTVSRATILHDPDGAFATLQAVTLESYPNALREAVVHYNHPLLRNTISSYWVQLEKATARGDLVSLNHRLTALLASYFDIIFAVNRALHPGEKRLLKAALSVCSSLPEAFERDLTETLKAAGGPELLLTEVTKLLDALDAWLEHEGFDVTGSRPVQIPAG